MTGFDGEASLVELILHGQQRAAFDPSVAYA
jgi:hypothetical protein